MGRIKEFQYARAPDNEPGLRQMGINQPYAYTLKELVSCRFPPQAMEALRKKIPAAAWPRFQGGGSAGSLIYARSYFLLYYCYACGKQELAEALDRYLAKEFQGKGGLDAFREAFGLKTDEDLARFEKEWLDFKYN